MDGHNFITHRRHRVWLDAPWLFSLITGMPMPGEFIEKNKKALAALDWIDGLLEFRRCYAWYFAIYCVIFYSNIHVAIFYGVIFLLFVMFTLMPLMPFKITLVERVLYMLYFPYYICMYSFVHIIIFAMLAVVLHCPIFILYYMIFYLAAFVLEYMMRRLVLRYTRNKYGAMYSDLEYAAFRAVYTFMDNEAAWLENEKINSRADMIRWYEKHVGVEENYS